MTEYVEPDTSTDPQPVCCMALLWGAELLLTGVNIHASRFTISRKQEALVPKKRKLHICKSCKCKEETNWPTMLHMLIMTFEWLIQYVYPPASFRVSNSK